MKTTKQRREQRKRAKLRKELELFKMPLPPIPAWPSMPIDIPPEWFVVNTIVPLEKPGTCRVVKKEQEKEDTMYFSDFDVGTETGVQKDHLLRQSAESFDDKRHQLQKDFGLVGDDPPGTVDDFVDRILAGKFVKPANSDKRIYAPGEKIIWRDPSIKEDRKAYDASEKKLYDAFSDLKDTIVIKDVDTGLAAYQAFKALPSTTFH
jgi:hypothetical protein